MLWMRIALGVLALFVPMVSWAWSTDTELDGERVRVESTHPLLAKAAIRHLGNDLDHQDLLLGRYGIQGLDGFLRDVYELDDGMKAEFHFFSGLYSESDQLGIEEYDRFSAEEAALRFHKTIELPFLVELSEGVHELIGPFPLLLDVEAYSLEELFPMGAMVEDNGFDRVNHHFHDPVNNEGLDQWVGTYIRGASALDRAMGIRGASGETPRNYYSLADAERYLYRTVVGETARERETAMGLHFLSLGHVLHLMQELLISLFQLVVT